MIDLQGPIIFYKEIIGRLKIKPSKNGIHFEDPPCV